MELRRLHFRAQLVAGGVVGGGKAAEVVVGGDGINGEECQPRSFGGFPDVAVRTYTYAADLSDPPAVLTVYTSNSRTGGKVKLIKAVDAFRNDSKVGSAAI